MKKILLAVAFLLSTTSLIYAMDDASLPNWNEQKATSGSQRAENAPFAWELLKTEKEAAAALKLRAETLTEASPAEDRDPVISDVQQLKFSDILSAEHKRAHTTQSTLEHEHFHLASGLHHLSCIGIDLSGQLAEKIKEIKAPLEEVTNFLDDIHAQ